MSDTARWVVVFVIVVLVVGLIALARGRDHRRGDDVGALGRGTAVATTVA